MSLFTIRKETVMSVCENIIKDSHQRTQEIKEKLIDEEMKRKTKKIWFKWFKSSKPKTREEAWRKIQDRYYNRDFFAHPGPIPPWSERDSIVTSAKDLLKACSISSGDTVQLDKKDANFIEKWL